MNARTNARIVIQLLIAIGVYTLFDAESLAENWKQHGAPESIADSLSHLSKMSGFAEVNNRIRGMKDLYHDVDVAECLLKMLATHNEIPVLSPPVSKGGLSSDTAHTAIPEREETRPAPHDAEAKQELTRRDPSSLNDHGSECNNDAPVLLTTRGETKPAGTLSHEADQLHPELNHETAYPETDGKPTLPEASDKKSVFSHQTENLSESPQTLPPQTKSDSREAPESDPAAKALQELLLQQKDPDAKPLPQANNAGAGHSGTKDQNAASLDCKDGKGPHTLSDLLRKTYYKHIESPRQEYRRRTESKVMFEKPLSRNYTVLLAGDSFMEEMTLSVGRGSYYRKSGIVFHSIARFSTGLTSVKDWNWQEKLAEGIDKYKPDIVLILLGANDMMSIVIDNKILAYKSQNWENKYRERAEALLDTALENNVMPIWIGLPVMTHEPFKTGIPIISRLHEEACANRNTVFVSTLRTLADENGKYQAYRMDSNGRKLRLRKKDKCHIAADGMLLVLDEVMPYIRSYVEYREKMDKTSHSKKEN